MMLPTECTDFMAILLLHQIADDSALCALNMLLRFFAATTIGLMFSQIVLNGKPYLRQLSNARIDYPT